MMLRGNTKSNVLEPRTPLKKEIPGKQPGQVLVEDPNK